jgi:hypothetical protein
VERQCGHGVSGPSGQAGILPVTAKTIALKVDRDAASPRSPAATQLPSDGMRKLRPASPGRHAGSLPARKVTTEMLTTTTAPMGFIFSLWRWAVLADAVSLSAIEYSGPSTSEREKNDDDSE